MENEKQEKEVKKDCLDCRFNNNGVCQFFGAINKPVLMEDCKKIN